MGHADAIVRYEGFDEMIKPVFALNDRASYSSRGRRHGSEDQAISIPSCAELAVSPLTWFAVLDHEDYSMVT